MKVGIINKSKHGLPSYELPFSAGMDLRSNIDIPEHIKPLERVLIPTGIFISLPEGFEAQIRPRSGTAYKHGITVLNSPGTIDSGYTGEIKVLLVNLSTDDYMLQDGDRIAQMVIAKHETIDWEEVDVLEKTERGDGGFGSTGI